MRLEQSQQTVKTIIVGKFLKGICSLRLLIAVCLSCRAKQMKFRGWWSRTRSWNRCSKSLRYTAQWIGTPLSAPKMWPMGCMLLAIPIPDRPSAYEFKWGSSEPMIPFSVDICLQKSHLHALQLLQSWPSLWMRWHIYHYAASERFPTSVPVWSRPGFPVSSAKCRVVLTGRSGMGWI